MNRKELLLRLINLADDINALEEELYKFGWDSDEDLVILAKEDMINILNKYITGQISDSILEKWAETLELREDVGYEEEIYEKIENIIYVLANPYLEGSLTLERAIEMRDSLTA